MEDLIKNLPIDKIEKASSREEVKYVDLNICPEILTIFYLSKITRIDLLTLTLLFERLGTGLYYLFYMLAKRKISFPSEANLLKAIKFTETVETLDNNYNNIHKIPDKDKEIFKELLDNLVDKRYIRVKVDVLTTTENVEGDEMPVTRVITPVVKSELNSAIKKYIRKEKRRLDKLGQMYTLFDKNSENRLALIDKIYRVFSEKVSESDNIGDLKEFISTLIDGYNN